MLHRRHRISVGGTHLDYPPGVRVLDVVNPNATSTSRRTRDLLLAALAGAADVTIAQTTHRDHAAELAEQSLGDGIDAVVAYGGDGTVNEVVNGLLARGPSSSVACTVPAAVVFSSKLREVVLTRGVLSFTG